MIVPDKFLAVELSTDRGMVRVVDVREDGNPSDIALLTSVGADPLDAIARLRRFIDAKLKEVR